MKKATTSGLIGAPWEQWLFFVVESGTSKSPDVQPRMVNLPWLGQPEGADGIVTA